MIHTPSSSTLNLIQKRGWALANRCFLCHEKEETIDRLLLHCTKTRVIWDLLFTLFRVSWVLPSSVRETLLNAWFICRQKAQEGVESNSFLHILAGLEGEK